MSNRRAGEPLQIVRALCIDAVIFHLVNTHRAAVVVAIMKASQYGDVETEALSGSLVDMGCLSGVAIFEVERRQCHRAMPSNKNDAGHTGQCPAQKTIHPPAASRTTRR